jgi:hypothetical protein
MTVCAERRVLTVPTTLNAASASMVTAKPTTAARRARCATTAARRPCCERVIGMPPIILHTRIYRAVSEQSAPEHERQRRHQLQHGCFPLRPTALRHSRAPTGRHPHQPDGIAGDSLMNNKGSYEAAISSRTILANPS